jgi:aromatic-L-amino-acid decarboxylase
MSEDNTTLDAVAAQHRQIGEAVTAIISRYVAALDSQRVVPHISVTELVDLFDEQLPVKGVAPDAILKEFEQKVLPNGMQIPSPFYFGLFNPTPLPIAVWADALASAINQNGAVWRNSSAANVIEARVIKWLCELMGYGGGAHGALTSGGSEANLVALKCARDRSIDGIRDRGVRISNGDLVFYASDQCHYSFVKSVDILGLGRENLRKIPSGENFHIRLDLLREQMVRDRDQGKVLCCIAGAAGATSTGIIDPLSELAEIAGEFGCWFHVDAAYGGGIALSTNHQEKLKGIERADSITIDPHKWMFVPFACGAVLVRDGGGVLRDSFDITPEYLSEDRGGVDVEFDGFRYGQLGTKRFNALKIWMAIKLLGVEGYGEIIDRQIELTQYFASRVDTLRGIERVGEVETAVCCFRFLPGPLKCSDGTAQDKLQQALQQRIERGGRVWLASTVLHGRRALRVNINSFLTRKEHIDELVTVIEHESNSMLNEGPNG